jgi:dienelactone hydrolase
MNRRISTLIYLLILAGCTPSTPSLDPAPATPSIAVAQRATPTERATETATATATAAPTASATAMPTATPTPVPSATATRPSPMLTPDPYAPLTIEALTNRSYGGGEVEIVESVEADGFRRYLIRYPSDGLMVYGFLNVPEEGERFPVALVLHGYIDPDDYETLAYSTRYADALVRAGYMVFHPNYRNYAPSDAGPNPYRIGYAIDTLNLIAIIRAQSQDPVGVLRRADAEQMHLMGHSMGGGIAQRVGVIRPNWVDAIVLYGSMTANELTNWEQIKIWSNGSSGDFELGATAEQMGAISAETYFDRLQAPVSIHHGAADALVPPEWSDALCTALTERGHPVECFSYTGMPHTFYGWADDALIARTVAFFERY